MTATPQSRVYPTDADDMTQTITTARTARLGRLVAIALGIRHGFSAGHRIRPAIIGLTVPALAWSVTAANLL